MKCTILVADGEASVATPMAEYLELHGCRVKKVTDGPGAIEVARREEPDLIILELLHPEIDGLEVCRRLRRAGKTAITPIIMISESEDEIDQVVSLKVGADTYLKKSIDYRELLARSRALLRRAGSSCEAESAVEQDSPLSPPAAKSELVAGPLWIDLAG
jgi:DNA-binding response OmpR family regulator